MTPKDAKNLIKASLKEKGYTREFDAKKRKKLTSQVYKKGYETRFTCASKKEAREMVAALKVIGINAGKPFAKGNSTMVPVYGKDQVEALDALRGKK